MLIALLGATVGSAWGAANSESALTLRNGTDSSFQLKVAYFGGRKSETGRSYASAPDVLNLDPQSNISINKTRSNGATLWAIDILPKAEPAGSRRATFGK